MNWIAINKLNSKITYSAKIRSSQEPQEVLIKPLGDGKIEAEFINMQKSISIGQSIVLYQDDVVLGGGIIQEVI